MWLHRPITLPGGFRGITFRPRAGKKGEINVVRLPCTLYGVVISGHFGRWNSETQLLGTSAATKESQPNTSHMVASILVGVSSLARHWVLATPAFISDTARYPQVISEITRMRYFYYLLFLTLGYY